MNGDSCGANLVLDREEVRQLKRHPVRRANSQMDVDDIVESDGLAILHKRFEHGKVDASFSAFCVRMTFMIEKAHSGFLQPGKVRRVVDDPHGIGLGEPSSKGVRESIVVRMDGGLKREPRHNNRSCQLALALSFPESSARATASWRD